MTQRTTSLSNLNSNGSPRTRSESRTVSNSSITKQLRSKPNSRSKQGPTKKNGTNKAIDSSSEQPSPSPSASSSSSSSSSSEGEDDDEDAQSDSPSDSFVLHRSLDLRNVTQNQPTTNAQPVFDIFSSRLWNLDKAQLKKFSSLKDTDLVQVHHPVPIEPDPKRNLTLLEIAPPINPIQSTSNSSALGKADPNLKNRLPKRLPDSLSGPSVSSLYYSPYSSFAPSYDTTGSSQTLDQSRTTYLSKKRLEDWCKRDGIYGQIEEVRLDLVQKVPASNASAASEDESTNRRTKRQKTRDVSRASERSDPPSQATITPEVTLSREDIRQKVSSVLDQNSRLISNLQERQFQRLRATNDNHLDPLLSASAPATASMAAKINRNAGLGSARIGQDEIREASMLIRSLSSLIAQRPRLISSHRSPPGTDGDSMENNDAEEPGSTSELSPETTLMPTPYSIRRSYALMIEPLEGYDDQNQSYEGHLPQSDSVGIQESVLNAKPNSRVAEFLRRHIEVEEQNVRRNKASLAINGIAGQTQQQHAASSSVSSPSASSPFRDPALSSFWTQNSVPNLNQSKLKAQNRSPSPLVSKLPQYHHQQRIVNSNHHQQPYLSSNYQQTPQSARFIGSPFSSRPSVVNSAPMIQRKINSGTIGITNGSGMNLGSDHHSNHRTLTGNVGMISSTKYI